MISPSQLRRWHAYLGLFIAPSVLFFCFTGALQIFSLHEAHGSYRPAVLLEKLSAVHKDQVFKEPHDHPAQDTAVSESAAADSEEHAPGTEDEKESAPTLVLKWFFLGVSLGLIASTLIGVWMGTTQIRRKVTAWALLLGGALIPICLLAMA